MMHAVVASRFGKPVDVLSMSTETPRPTLEAGKRQLLVKVKACSLSPGDWRMLSGETSAVRTPASWPYVPGQDICGEVVDVDVGVDGFKVGDEVVATWGGMMPMGGLAEYCIVEADLSVIKPPELTPVECAALVNSASHALIGVDGAVLKSTDRVLVLGGSGGAGSALIQLVKDAGVAFIAATSSDTALLTSLGVDRPIDYTVENWWEVQAFLDDPFDVVFDLAEGTVGWNRCRSSGVVKMGWAGGRYYAFLLDEWEIVAKSKMFFIAFAGLLLSRLGSGFVLSKLNLAPAYTMKLSTPDTSVITRVLDLAVAGRLKPVLVGAAPYQFTAASTIAAFDMLRSRRAKGKVVIKVAD